MKFKFVADTVIEAEDIDDCFIKISAHFLDPDNSDLEHEGVLEISPLDES